MRVVLSLAAAVSLMAQTRDPFARPTRWLESNYRHVNVHTTISTAQMQRLLGEDPVLMQAQNLQIEALRLLQHARDSEDMPGAVEALHAANANLGMIAGLSGQAAGARAQSALYLIALAGNIVRPAIAYWVEGSTLHYVTPDKQVQNAPLSSVNRELTQRLNRERNVEMKLDAPPAARETPPSNRY